MDIGLLTNRPHKIWLGCPPFTLALNTGAPQGCVFRKLRKDCSSKGSLREQHFCAKFLLIFKEEQQKAS